MRKRSMYFLGILGAAILAALAGCSSAEGNKEENVDGVTAKALASYPEEPVYKNEEERWEAQRTKEISQDFLDAYEEFTVKTTSGLLKDEKENVVYSPLGLYYVLALAAEGADGSTREEILGVLGYADVEKLSEDCQAAFEALYHVTNEKNNKMSEYGEYPPETRYMLRIANSLWADKAVEVKEEFAKRGAKYYYSDIYSADLQAPETAKAMADWVSERTNGLIVPSESPAEDTLISLKNTVYFYDEWLDRFQKEDTKEDIFTCADGTEISCDFMNRTMASHGFRKGDNFTASSLSLKNGVMEFYLPDEGVDVHTLIENPEIFNQVIHGRDGQMMGEVVWKIPKFSYGSSTGLGDMLKALGMKAAFEEDADFSRLSDVSPLFISSVNQDAHIGIDENGVEAAAYTEISWAGAAPPEGRADMILDRPFLYVVKNRGKVIFVGICENPAKE